VFASSLTVAILVVVRARFPDWMPDPQAWLRHATSYEVANYRLIVRTVLVAFLLAVLIATGLGWTTLKLARRTSIPTRFRSTPALYNGLFEQIESGKATVVDVRMIDESVIRGVVSEMDPRAGRDQGWLVLEEPLRHFAPGNSEVPIGGWQRVALPYERIGEVWIRFPNEIPGTNQAAGLVEGQQGKRLADNP